MSYPSHFLKDTDDYKFDRHIAALIEMEDAKKLFNDCWNTKNDALKETPSATSQCHIIFFYKFVYILCRCY
ncbi:hypothetical protein HanRHA438_Chr08g0350541 [Helianthus annuus]|nr:hypothetical protein HanIR_Chr08g0366241 [Helianthus annuus]KAJ0553536.1 hypothetical protein HanHA89_Chr08g0297491 [Helianthus annuus]KAJ0897875.1 hypothetical protein HanRHA438_Chr08g0350541 [Helianthus annuus]